MNIALWIAQGLLAAMYLTAGDDADAKSRVAELVRDAGMRPVDTGPLSRARQIEGMQLSAHSAPIRAAQSRFSDKELSTTKAHEGAQRKALSFNLCAPWCPLWLEKINR